MARSGKWIKGTSAEQHVSEVAKQAIRARLCELGEILPKAATRPDDDIEFIHQLRVTSRRSVAALEMFEQLLPRKRADQLKKMLRRIRQAAGNRRDFDVLYDRLSQRAKQTPGSGIDRVLGGMARRRVEVHDQLSKVYRYWNDKGYDYRMVAFLKRIRWRGGEEEPRFESAARVALQPLVDDFFQSSQIEFSDVAAIHQMRISGKRLRYTMELTAGAFDRFFRKNLYAAFTEVQERLGNINDHAFAALLLELWSGETTDEQEAAVLHQLASLEKQLLRAACELLRTWWTPNRSLQLRQQFNQYLTKSSVQGDGK